MVQATKAPLVLPPSHPRRSTNFRKTQARIRGVSGHDPGRHRLCEDCMHEETERRDRGESQLLLETMHLSCTYVLSDLGERETWAEKCRT